MERTTGGITKMSRIIEERKQQYAFPTFEEYKKEYLEAADEENYTIEDKKQQFFNEWIDTSVGGLIWDSRNIMSDYTSEQLGEDEREYIKRLDTEELWIEVVENRLQTLIKGTRDAIPEEEILERMNPAKKKHYLKLKESLKPVKVARELK